jgi:hypothetical protein
LVSIENSDNAAVGSYLIELLFAPPASPTYQITPGVTAPLVLSSGNGNTPTATLNLSAPAVYGCYRIRLTVWPLPDRSGVPDVDIRCVCVLTPNQRFVLPPFQYFPLPLPLDGVGAKPDELNFYGQPFGWAGPNFEHPTWGGYRLVNATLEAMDAGGGGGGAGSLQEAYEGGTTIGVTTALGPVRVNVTGTTSPALVIYHEGQQIGSIGGPAAALADTYLRGAPAVTTKGQSIHLEGGGSTVAFAAGDFVAAGGGASGPGTGGSGYLLGGASENAPGRAVLGVGTTLGEGLVVDASTVDQWGAATTGYMPQVNAERGALDWLPNPVPQGGVPFDCLQRDTQSLTGTRSVRFVTSVDGTDAWFPGDNACWGQEHALPIGLAVIDENGIRTYYANAELVDGYTPSLVVREPQTGRTFLFSHYILPNPSNNYVTPTQIYVQEILTTTPFSLSAPTVLLGQDITPTVLRGFVAPGDGYIYLSVRTTTTYSAVGRLNLTTLFMDQVWSSSGTTVHTLAFDADVTKYGDGYPRLYGLGRFGCMLLRWSLQDLTTLEAEVQVGSGQFGGLYAGGLTVNGAGNYAHMLAFNQATNAYSAVRFSLQPFGTEVYHADVPGNNGGRAVGSVYHPATGKFICLRDYLSGIETAYVDIFTDNGSALTHVATYAVPNYMGNASGYPWRSDFDFDPMLTVIAGVAYIPLVGGHNDPGLGIYAYNNWDRMETVLSIDLAAGNDVVNVTSRPSVVWRSPFGVGDVSSVADVLSVDSLHNVTLPSLASGTYEQGRCLTPDYDTNEFTLEYPGHRLRYVSTGAPTYSAASETLLLDRKYDGAVIAYASTLTKPLELAERSVVGGSTEADYKLRFTSAAARTANDNYGKFSITSQIGRLIYGLTGNPSTGLASYVSHSYGEVLDLMWDNASLRWNCVGRYRPWETVAVSAVGPTTLYGGRVFVAVTTGASGTRDIRLPAIFGHDDEILVKDVAGSAHLCPIRVYGYSDTIDAVLAANPISIVQPFGYLHMKYDSTVSTWSVVSEMGTERSMAIAPPTAASTGDVEGYGAVLTYGATLGPGGTPGVDWRRVESTTIVGPANALMEAWQIDTDGYFRQTDTTNVGNLYLPLSLVIGARLAALYIYLQRLTGVGVAATTPATAMIQRRTRAVGNTAPGAWESVPSIICVNSTPANLVQELIVGDTNYATNGYWTVVTGYDYRLMINGEASTNAQPVKLLNMHAYMR